MIIVLISLGFKKSSSKTMEIGLIVFNSILIFFTLLCFIFFQWGYISEFNLVMFILIFIIIIINIILSSFIRNWRAKNLIKTEMRDKGITFAKTGLGLTIVLLIFTIVEEFAYIITVNSSNASCIENADILDEKCNISLKSYISMNIIAYFTFCFLEYFSILGIVIWCFLKNRIVDKLDYLTDTQMIYVGQNNVLQPVVVQTGQIVHINEQQIVPPLTSYQYPNMNVQYNNINNIEGTLKLPNQINSEIPNTQEARLRNNV